MILSMKWYHTFIPYPLYDTRATTSHIDLTIPQWLLIAIVPPKIRQGLPFSLSHFCNYHHHVYHIKIFYLLFTIIIPSCLFRTRIGQSLSKHSLLCLVNKYSSRKTVGSFSREAGIQMTKTNLPTLIVTISSRHESI